MRDRRLRERERETTKRERGGDRQLHEPESAQTARGGGPKKLRPGAGVEIGLS